MEIAMRIRGLREILEYSEEKMARRTDVTVEEYREYEAGQRDFSFTFLYACAKTFGVDIVELLTSRLCSMRTTVFPTSTSRCSTSISICTSAL
ncbi:helix-turn-helix transcriptional regulator [Ruminococcaceae bacterium OttesenSCG-928-L11]|nr:helix-turn-helix transcriptional regulator [Ruminococcaceae bacterium OttesenSCG-928-L11]